MSAKFISPKYQQVDCPVLKLQSLHGRLKTILSSPSGYLSPPGVRNIYHFVVTIYKVLLVNGADFLFRQKFLEQFG